MDECVASCCGVFAICGVSSAGAFCGTRAYGSRGCGCCGSSNSYAGCCGSCCQDKDDPFSDEVIAREVDEERARAHAEAQRNEDRIGAHSPLMTAEQPRHSKEMEVSPRPPPPS